MIRKFTRFAFQSLLLAFAMCVTSHAVAQTAVRIMPLGDSITAAPGCWRAYLWTQLQAAGFTNIDFVGTSTDRSGCGFAFDENHEGHSGFAITGIADQNLLPPWLAATNPNIVIVHLGTNDMWGHFITTPTKLTAFTKLIGQMRANNPNMKIIVAQIIPMDPTSCTTCNADVIEFNNALPAWAAGLTTAQSPITLVNQFTGFDLAVDSFDRVHPVDSGFQKMSAKFLPAVVAALNGAPPGPTLTVTRAGTGPGTVTSNPAGINCGTACSASFTNGASVTLSAAATGGSAFAGWSGACTGTGGCTVSMTQARAVTATFLAPPPFLFTVTKAGNGTGTVTSNPAGINCGTTCSANFASGTSVTLTAASAAGSIFAGWSGACTGTGNCTVSLTQARSVTATFNTATTFALSVTRVITAGGGNVTSNPAGINCGTTCSANYATGTSVTLTATPVAGSLFQGWSGACTGTATTCTVVMTQARNVTATFMGSVPPVSLTVTLAGTGSGTVTSNPGGINCPTACIAGFQSGNVTLTATPAAGATFAGWSGACTGTGTCTVVMSQPRAVTATFNSTGTGGTCANPITFTNNTGNFNTTGAACYRTNATVNGWGCSNFDGRTLTVGGQARTCGQLPLVRSADGYYYFSVTAGQFPWASLFAW